MKNPFEEKKKLWDKMVRIWVVDARALAFVTTMILLAIAYFLQLLGVDMSWLLGK